MALNYVTFNQDYSHLAVGTTKGFRIYYTDPFSLAYSSPDVDVSLLSMLFSTSLVAIVLSPRRLAIRNTKRNNTICELTFPTTVLGVRMNRKRLVVVLEDQIYVYDISNMKLLDTVDTSPNPNGICALSPTHDPSYLVFPLPQPSAPTVQQLPSHVPPSTHSPAQPQSGALLVQDAATHTPLNVIEAHRAPLSCITISSSGTLLATASEKGTIIRVFELPSGKKLAQFRRGTMPARVSSMAFNSTGSLLVVSSATETVHIFKIADGTRALSTASINGRPGGHARSTSKQSVSSNLSDDDISADRPTSPLRSPSLDLSSRAHDGTFSGMLRRTSQSVGKAFAASVAGYMPTSVTEMLEPARDFAWFKLARVRGMPGGDDGDDAAAAKPGLAAGIGAGLGFGGRGGSGATPSGALKSVVAVSRNAPQVMVVTSEGMFFVYNIDLEVGGEGVLVRKFSILDEGGAKAKQSGDGGGSGGGDGASQAAVAISAARRRASMGEGERELAGLSLSP